MWHTEPFTGLPPVDELLKIAEEVDPVQFELDRQHPNWERALKYKEYTLDILFAKYFRIVTIPALQTRANGLQPAQTLLIALEICEDTERGQYEKLERNRNRLKALGVDRAVIVHQAGWINEESFIQDLRELLNSQEFVYSINGELADSNYRWKDLYEAECVKNNW